MIFKENTDEDAMCYFCFGLYIVHNSRQNQKLSVARKMVAREVQMENYGVLDSITTASYIATKYRLNNGTETLEDIKRMYHLHYSLFIVLRNQILCYQDMQTMMHKYANLHSLCSTSFCRLESELRALDSLHLVEKCMAVKTQVDNVVLMLQLPRPRHSDSDLQAAQWEVSIQKSMLKNRPQHGNFSGNMAHLGRM